VGLEIGARAPGPPNWDMVVFADAELRGMEEG